MMEDEQPVIEDGGSQLPADALFQLLTDKRRRTILRCLLDGQAPKPLDELVRECLSALNGVSSDSNVSRMDLQTSFHHVHLPMLSEADVIEYRFQREIVHPKPSIGEFEPFLEFAEPLERPADSLW